MKPSGFRNVSEAEQRIRDQIYQHRTEIYKRAAGRWPQVLLALGIPSDFLKERKPGPCPMCGGRDRFTFTDKTGNGDFVCRGCPPNGPAKQAFGGYGVTLLMKYHGWTWRETIDYVDEKLADPTTDRLKDQLRDARRASFQERTPQEEVEVRRAKLEKMLAGSMPVGVGDPVWKYLTSRIPGLDFIPSALRYHPSLEYFQQVTRDGHVKYESRGRYPAMLALITDEADRLCGVHRTYLSEEGTKAVIRDANGNPACDEHGELLDVRKQSQALPGLSKSVKLALDQPSRLGVAEGIETSLAASVFAGVSTWSLLSTGGMRTFQVPAWVSELVIFADNDHPDSKGRRPGFDAAHALARSPDVLARVQRRDLKVLVRAPSTKGTDICDLLLNLQRRAA